MYERQPVTALNTLYKMKRLRPEEKEIKINLGHLLLRTERDTACNATGITKLAYLIGRTAGYIKLLSDRRIVRTLFLLALVCILIRKTGISLMLAYGDKVFFMLK